MEIMIAQNYNNEFLKKTLSILTSTEFAIKAAWCRQPNHGHITEDKARWSLF